VLRLGELLVLAMEYVDGEDLFKVVSTRGPLPVANACYYIHQAALGLQHACEKGMVHRDIKPDNLILACDGKKHVVKILDFGLAKATREQDDNQGKLTRVGQMMGTPDYISPEQILDAATADIRADIYSLGCTLYFLLTGSAPFKGQNMYDILQGHISRKPTSPHELRNEVPPELATIIDKMMAKDANDRYQKPVEVAQALVPFVKGVKPLPAIDAKAGPSGKTATKSGGGGKSVGQGSTPAPAEKPKTKFDPALKKTILEAEVTAIRTPQPKLKPRQINPPARNGRKVLLAPQEVSGADTEGAFRAGNSYAEKAAVVLGR
jgi:serine/threonine protein kinase